MSEEALLQVRTRLPTPFRTCRKLDPMICLRAMTSIFALSTNSSPTIVGDAVSVIVELAFEIVVEGKVNGGDEDTGTVVILAVGSLIVLVVVTELFSLANFYQFSVKLTR